MAIYALILASFNILFFIKCSFFRIIGFICFSLRIINKIAHNGKWKVFCRVVESEFTCLVGVNAFIFFCCFLGQSTHMTSEGADFFLRLYIGTRKMPRIYFWGKEDITDAFAGEIDEASSSPSPLFLGESCYSPFFIPLAVVFPSGARRS